MRARSGARPKAVVQTLLARLVLEPPTVPWLDPTIRIQLFPLASPGSLSLVTDQVFVNITFALTPAQSMVPPRTWAMKVQIGQSRP
jgi:hypothetical protein